jgi:hypothetical protein
MLLRCVLHDAIYRDYSITDGCLACQAIGDICAAHWDEHQARRAEYHALVDHLELYEELDSACPLTVKQQQVLAAAVPEAIAYRRGQNAAEDAALLVAYQSLHRRLPARSRAAASLSPAIDSRPSCFATGTAAD